MAGTWSIPTLVGFTDDRTAIRAELGFPSHAATTRLPKSGQAISFVRSQYTERSRHIASCWSWDKARIRQRRFGVRGRHPGSTIGTQRMQFQRRLSRDLRRPRTADVRPPRRGDRLRPSDGGATSVPFRSRPSAFGALGQGGLASAFNRLLFAIQTLGRCGHSLRRRWNRQTGLSRFDRRSPSPFGMARFRATSRWNSNGGFPRIKIERYRNAKA